MIVAVSGVHGRPEEGTGRRRRRRSPSDLATKMRRRRRSARRRRQCGDGKAEGVPLGVCIWADRGSLGMVVVYFKSAGRARREFVTMRGEIEKQG